MTPSAAVPASSPAPTVTAQADRWVLKVGTNAGATVRRATEPAPTLVMGQRVNGVTWHADEDADTIEEAYRNRGHREAEDLT